MFLGWNIFIYEDRIWIITIIFMSITLPILHWIWKCVLICANFTIYLKNSYCRSGKYSNHFVRLVQCTCVICCCACTNTQCAQCLVNTCTKSGSRRINKNSQKNNVLRGLGLCIPIYHDVWTVKPLEDKWAKTWLLKNTVSFLKLYLHYWMFLHM